MMTCQVRHHPDVSAHPGLPDILLGVGAGLLPPPPPRHLQPGDQLQARPASLPPRLDRVKREDYYPVVSTLHCDNTYYQVYPVIHVVTGVVFPISLIIGWNLRIVQIAKYHQFRIANVIFKMTFTHLNMTANERRRQEQSTALKKFQGMHRDK